MKKYKKVSIIFTNENEINFDDEDCGDIINITYTPGGVTFGTMETDDDGNKYQDVIFYKYDVIDNIYYEVYH